MSLIQIENVNFQYPGADQPSLVDCSLKVEEGEFLAIMGGNGSGKTTLCKLFNGLIPHYYSGDISGQVTIDGQTTLDKQVTDFSELVGYVYQDFENQLVQAKVIEDASYSPLNFGYEDFQERGKQALERVGLLGKDNEYIWELSGGQKHLLALAGAISLNPKILIVDEPVAQLDPQHAKEFYNILRSLNEKEKITIIVIEHHTEFVAEYCDHVVLMDKGSIAWKKDVHQALTSVEDLQARQIFPPQVTQAAHRLSLSDHETMPICLKEAVDYFKPYKENQVQNQLHQLKVTGSKREKEKIAEMSEVSFSYKTIDRQKKRVLDSVSLEVFKGDRVALVGNNGAGKSSLLRLLTGISQAESGQVLLKDKNIADYSPEHFADTVTYIYQNPEEMFIEDSIKNDIEFFLKSRNKTGYKEAVEDIIDSFQLKDLQDRDGRLMSGGQQRRASLAIGVAMQPSLILLDEPTANLDIATRKYITQFIQALKEEVEAVIIATHDMQLVSEWANRIIVMNNGRIIHDGNRDSVFSDDHLLRTAGLTPPQILELSKQLQTNLSYSVEEFSQTFIAKQERKVGHGASW